MSRPTWDDLRPGRDALQAAAAAAETARQEEERIRRQALRPGRPGWLYDPVERRWTWAGNGWQATLCWVGPSHGWPAEWRYRAQRGGERQGGGLKGNLSREQAMRIVEEWLTR